MSGILNWSGAALESRRSSNPFRCRRNLPFPCLGFLQPDDVCVRLITQLRHANNSLPMRSDDAGSEGDDTEPFLVANKILRRPASFIQNGLQEHRHCVRSGRVLEGLAGGAILVRVVELRIDPAIEDFIVTDRFVVLCLGSRIRGQRQSYASALRRRRIASRRASSSSESLPNCPSQSIESLGTSTASNAEPVGVNSISSHRSLPCHSS